MRHLGQGESKTGVDEVLIAEGSILILLPASIPRSNTCLCRIYRRHQATGPSVRSPSTPDLSATLSATTKTKAEESRQVRYCVDFSRVTELTFRRFRSSPNGVLIATDVASRGLDIPHVHHVVHFNLPRTADAYIHRSGRTARAQNPGFALQLCTPEEKGMQRALMRSLDRGKSPIMRNPGWMTYVQAEHELPELNIESGFLPKLRERIRLAKKIEKAQHGVKKENHEKNWLREAAEAMDVDLDPSM